MYHALSSVETMDVDLLLVIPVRIEEVLYCSHVEKVKNITFVHIQVTFCIFSISYV